MRESFDSDDIPILILDGERQTGIDPFAIDQDGAGTASALVTAFLGAHEAKVIPKQIKKRCPDVSRSLHRLFIDL